MPFTYNWAPNSYYFNNTNTGPVPTSDLLVYVNSKDSASYNGSGSTWNDLSGNNNNMTISNATWDSVNKAFNFNGTNSYISTPNIYSQLTSGNALVSQTQEVWYKSSSTNGVIVDETNNLGQTAWHDSIIELVSGDTKGRYWNMASPYVSLGSNVSSQWNYVCLRYNGSTNTIDGNLNGTFTSSQAFTRLFAPSPAVIYYVLGLADFTNMGSGSYFNGQMAIYRTYKRALTNTEITNNYNAQRGLFGL